MKKIIQKFKRISALVRGNLRRCRLLVTGCLCLAMAGMIGSCLLSNDDESALSELEKMANYDYLPEIQRLRDDKCLEEAKELAKYVFETPDMPNQEAARKIYDEIDAEQKNWWNRTKRVVKGFATGEGQSIEELGGSVASDMMLYGDVRDLCKHGYYKVTGNEKYDRFIILLAGFGLATEFMDVVDWFPAAAKAFRRAGALSKNMIELITNGIKKSMKAKKLDGELKVVINGVKSTTESLGFARARRVMRHIDTGEEMATVSKAAKWIPNETYAVVKYGGKEGVKSLMKLSDAEIKILKCATKKGPLAVKNWRKFGKKTKEKTVVVRQCARLAKSVQAGHLGALIKKLVAIWAALRFAIMAVVGLLLVCSGRCFWLAFRRNNKDEDDGSSSHGKA